MKANSSDTSSPTVKQIVSEYRRHCERNNVWAESTRISRERIFDAWLARFGDRHVDALKAHELSTFIDSQPGLKSSATRKQWATSINGCLNWAADSERIVRNPWRRVRYQESESRPPMEDDVFADVCAVANKRFERAVRFLRLTGCRLNELCQLTWASVDLDKGVAFIEQHKSRRVTKRPRVLVLVPEVIELLKSIRNRQPADYQGVVFLNNHDRPWNKTTLGQQLNRLKRRGLIDTKATLHGLRHAWAHRALANGAPLPLVAQGLGHSSPNFTFKVYGHLSEAVEAVRGAAQLASPANG